MRELTDQTKRSKRRRISRSYRRAALASAVMLFGSSVAVGDNHLTTRLTPPLPESAPIKSIQRNPFFVDIADSPVKLASGKERSTIRLKPIGTAIGLQPIGGDAPIAVRPQPMTISQPTGNNEIHANPLVDSTPAAELVDVDVAAVNDRIQQIELKRRRHDDCTLPLPPADIGGPTSSAQIMVPVPKHESLESTAKPEPAAVPLAARAAPKLATQEQAATVETPIPTVDPPVPTTSPAQLAEAPVNVAPAAPIESTPQETAESVQSIPTQIGQPASLQPIPSLANSTPLVQAPRPPESSEIPATPQPESTADGNDSEEAEPAAESQPVFFSMSDTSSAIESNEDLDESPSDTADSVTADSVTADSVTADSVTADSNTADDAALVKDTQDPSPVTSNPLVELAEAPTLEETAEPDRSSYLPEPVTIAEVAEDQIESVADPNSGLSIVQQSPASLNVVEETAPTNIIYRNELADASANGSTMSLAKSRYRPPVAVDAPPLTIERTNRSVPRSAPAVASLPISDTAAGLLVDADGQTSQSIKLHMTRAQVRSLTLNGEVRRISVADKNVCQAFATGPNQLKLIGVGNGVTRLVVWEEPKAEHAARVRTFEIHVAEAVEATGNQLGGKVQLLNHSIANAFPQANIRVWQYHDQLIVTGYCGDEESAKKIIRMVRKTCLIPVQDEIKVGNFQRRPRGR